MMMSFRSTFFRGFMEGFRVCREIQVIHTLARESPVAEAGLNFPLLDVKVTVPWAEDLGGMVL